MLPENTGSTEPMKKSEILQRQIDAARQELCRLDDELRAAKLSERNSGASALIGRCLVTAHGALHVKGISATHPGYLTGELVNLSNDFSFSCPVDPEAVVEYSDSMREIELEAYEEIRDRAYQFHATLQRYGLAG
jgi:hypothetical protein